MTTQNTKRILVPKKAKQDALTDNEKAQAEIQRLAGVADALHAKAKNVDVYREETASLRQAFLRLQADWGETKSQLDAARAARAEALAQKEAAEARAVDEKRARDRVETLLETNKLELEYARERLKRLTDSAKEDRRTDLYLPLFLGGLLAAFIAFAITATLGDIGRKRYEACLKVATTPAERLSCREGR